MRYTVVPRPGQERSCLVVRLRMYLLQHTLTTIYTLRITLCQAAEVGRVVAVEDAPAAPNLLDRRQLIVLRLTPLHRRLAVVRLTAMPRALSKASFLSLKAATAKPTGIFSRDAVCIIDVILVNFGSRMFVQVSCLSKAVSCAGTDVRPFLQPS